MSSKQQIKHRLTSNVRRHDVDKRIFESSNSSLSSIQLSSKRAYQESFESRQRRFGKGVRPETDQRRAEKRTHSETDFERVEKRVHSESNYERVEKRMRSETDHRRVEKRVRSGAESYHSVHRHRDRSPLERKLRPDMPDYAHDSRRHYTSMSSSTSNKPLRDKIEEILQTEDHHVENVRRNSDGDITDVTWCPKHIRRDIKKRVPGGGALLHHRCRGCRRICLHLLGRYGSSDRKCLVCSAPDNGWSGRDVPSWYFHEGRCERCR